MSQLIVGYLLALLLSLLVSSWRMAIWALATESLLSGLVLLRAEGLGTWSTRIQFADLVVVRSVVAPWVLMSALKKLKIPSEFDTIPANFIIWIFAAVLFISSFWFGQVFYPSDFSSAGYLGTAVFGVLIGLFVLSNQKWIHGQIIGLLTLEAGIVLSEILTPHHEAWEIQIGLTAVFAWMVALFLRFLSHFSVPIPQEEGGATCPPEEKDVL